MKQLTVFMFVLFVIAFTQTTEAYPPDYIAFEKIQTDISKQYVLDVKVQKETYQVQEVQKAHLTPDIRRLICVFDSNIFFIGKVLRKVSEPKQSHYTSNLPVRSILSSQIDRNTNTVS